MAAQTIKMLIFHLKQFRKGTKKRLKNYLQTNGFPGAGMMMIYIVNYN